MVDAVRAALRLLPRPGPCGRAARAHPQPQSQAQPQARAEQAVLGSLAAPSQAANCERPVLPPVSGFARFARAFLSYVGLGVSVVAASELAGLSVVHAREEVSSASSGSSPSMAAAEARAIWQRSSMSRHYVAQEDLLKAQKAVRGAAPAVPEAKNEAADYVAKRGGDANQLFTLSNYWVALDAHYCSEEWPLSSCAGRHFRPEYVGSGSDYLVCDEVTKPSKPSSDVEDIAEGVSLAGKQSAGRYRRIDTDYGDASDLELEWQLVVEPQLKGKPGLKDLEGSQKQQIEDVESSPEEHSELEPEIGEQARHRDVNVKNLEGTRKLSGSATSPSRAEQSLSRRAGSSFQGRSTPISKSSNPLKDASEDRLQLQPGNVSWRTARRGELAALVAEKAGGQLENCDLPIPLITSRIKPPLESCKLGTNVHVGDDLYRSVDGKLLASLLQGHEPTRLDNLRLPTSSLVLSTCAPASGFSPAASQPLPIPSASGRVSENITCSTDNRNTSWHGGGVNYTVSESAFLGQALCHSQTRAREAETAVRRAEQAAEEAAEEAIKEKQQLVHMFFREASLSLTYRQWVSVLEAENFCLRIYAGNQALWIQDSIFNPFTSLDRLSINRWRNLGKDYAKRHMQDHFSGVWHSRESRPRARGSHIMMGYTLGLAFALGLGLAGAGLVLGWSMGWILLPC